MRFFASARDAAGRGRDVIDAPTVAALVDVARERYGPTFAAVLRTSRIWVNGEAAAEHTPIGPGDEVAILPPVSGG